ncbi:6-hydroxy-D-nicotine oxidase [Cryphonectria parasitica EP155]|uniref:6-hydroxy-D-nicotine oxidase n=1 Tax=Cryphonectria parasitica (strain ATCC 38755 / EP155) TaxID=660469 RepID=A0A9P4Y483_CRYP1|nr:6-hydroxy-D-nicotine oxidase [Cryphonectria parasitica EP155]KAF3766642.1 6-hydroxy-D-nicotine oxidase [Cryphonectria parasitica EP155]
MLCYLILWPVVAAALGGNQTCKCFPWDSCWPSENEWNTLNTTVTGRLIKTVPLGSPCHDPNYNESLCNDLASEWTYSPVHINSSSSVQAPIFANASCDPFTSEGSPCLFGNYVRYAVKAMGADDIAATIRFAEKHNIRLVIRNTAHDYMGRSTGAGGLAIWTHFLKDTQIKDWSDAEYTGKAIQIGAGIEGYEALDAAAAVGLVAVTGECPTVGVAGGYVQNGGHSPLATALGLAADQTLEFEVVTANGEMVTASPFSNNSDLFWALSGSGAGNYGVVVSVTLKLHADAITSGAAFVIEELGLDYAAVLDAWHTALPGILDAGNMATYYATNTSMTLYSLTGYNRTKADLAIALAPVLSSFASMNVSVQPNYTSFDSYQDYYTYYFGPLPAGHFGAAGGSLIGGRFLLRDALPDVGAAINASTLQIGGTFIGQAVNVSRFESATRAVMPQWRHAAVMSSYSLPYSFNVPFSEMKARQDRITNEIMPKIEAVTPGAGAYINEADYQQRDWQDVFFGSNYDNLLMVKRKYDPKGLFWNPIAVGSEGWEILPDGRMCKTNFETLAGSTTG